MLKSEDLMIGDWVEFPIGNERIIDLPYIMGKGICASFAASATLFPVEVEKLEPIQLTPEILEKNGFEKYGQRYAGIQQWVTKEGERISLVQCISDGTWGLGGDLWIESVHELQNWLHLRKKTKEIVL